MYVLLCNFYVLVFTIILLFVICFERAETVLKAVLQYCSSRSSRSGSGSCVLEQCYHLTCKYTRCFPLKNMFQSNSVQPKCIFCCTWLYKDKHRNRQILARGHDQKWRLRSSCPNKSRNVDFMTASFIIISKCSLRENRGGGV